MTPLGTFIEGLCVIVLAIVCAILSKLLDIPWLLTAAPILFAIALTYVGGGAAGKAQMFATLKRLGLLDEIVNKSYVARMEKSEL